MLLSSVFLGKWERPSILLLGYDYECEGGGSEIRGGLQPKTRIHLNFPFHSLDEA